MAASSIYVDAPTQADIDVLSGIIYVNSRNRDYFVELSARFPNGVFVFLRSVRRVYSAERRPRDVCFEVHDSHANSGRKSGIPKIGVISLLLYFHSISIYVCALN